MVNKILQAQSEDKSPRVAASLILSHASSSWLFNAFLSFVHKYWAWLFSICQGAHNKADNTFLRTDCPHQASIRSRSCLCMCRISKQLCFGLGRHEFVWNERSERSRHPASTSYSNDSELFPAAVAEIQAVCIAKALCNGTACSYQGAVEGIGDFLSSDGASLGLVEGLPAHDWADGPDGGSSNGCAGHSR